VDTKKKILQLMTEIHNLLSASLRYCKGTFSSDILTFLEETVKAAVEDETVMDEEETMTMLLDAGLGDLDEDDLNSLASTISLMTGSDDKEVEPVENDVADDDGTCELCERYIRRTFHHLIPKETHNRYLKKKTLPANIKAVAVDIGVDPNMNRAWLNTYGTMICGSCHRAVHKSASNDDLAENFNTVELLLQHPKIYAFVKYNSKQPVKRGRI
jgi:hypothetical protein